MEKSEVSEVNRKMDMLLADRSSAQKIEELEMLLNSKNQEIQRLQHENADLKARLGCTVVPHPIFQNTVAHDVSVVADKKNAEKNIPDFCSDWIFEAESGTLKMTKRAIGEKIEIKH